MTKYGIEKMIGKTYPNNMPAYDGELPDEEIIAALSFIKSTWSKPLSGSMTRSTLVQILNQGAVS